MKKDAPLEVDLAIAGNGAIGCALALQYAAAHAGARIALIGPARRPASASAAAAAMLNVFAELDPGALDYPVARAKVELARTASGAWRRHLELLGSRSRVAVPIDEGTYLLAQSDVTSATRFDAIVGYMRALGEPFHEVDPGAIRGVDHRASRTDRAVYIEEEGRLDARELLRAYDDAFANTPSVQPIDDEVIDASPGWTLRLASGQDVKAPLVVIAAGARSQELIASVGLADRIPRIVAGVGTAVVMDGLAEPTEKVVRVIGAGGVAGGIYVVPTGAGRSYVGATTHVHVHGTPETSAGDVQQLVEGAARLVHPDFTRARVHEVLFGWRPMTLDTYPLLGQTSLRGLWVASGTRRDGLHLSPRIAEELVRCMPLDEQPFGGVFRPERPLLLEVPRALAMERAVASVTRSGAEDDALAYVERIYRASGFDDEPFGIPVEMLEIFAQAQPTRS